MAWQGGNPRCVSEAAHREISTVVGNGRRPKARQSLLCEVGAFSYGEDAENTRGSPLCLKAINPKDNDNKATTYEQILAWERAAVELARKEQTT